MMATIDPVELACKLINCPSITPEDAGAMDIIINLLEPLGFKCDLQKFNHTLNLYAKYGNTGNNLCFAGHTDVVPAHGQWSYNPFNAVIDNNILYGRGACDMKSAIAAFIAAIIKYLPDLRESTPKLIQESREECSGASSGACPLPLSNAEQGAGRARQRKQEGCLSILLTSDEEGSGKDGTVKMLEYLSGEKIDYAIVGEPTNPEVIGEMIKIGRRGSINFKLTVKGTQGHVAYPLLADNPITKLVKILDALTNLTLDDGNEFFDPSNLEITSIDVANNITNIIPEAATAAFNIRFNNIHTSKTLYNLVTTICSHNANNYILEVISHSESFLNEPDDFCLNAQKVVAKLTGKKTELSTTGGTSDARFITNYTKVFEFGLINKTAHKVDENVNIADIYLLTDIYYELISEYFS